MKMKSLREEIKSDIYNIAGGKDTVGIRWVDCDKITDSIISKIEKRIDEIQKTCYDDFEIGTCERIKELLK